MASRMWTAALAAVLVLSACGGGAAPPRTPPSSPGPAPAPFPVTLTDDDGVAVTIEAAPKRIVTWAPSNTEILFGLGLGPRIVGVSGSFDNYPPAAASITSVAGEGGVTPDVEKVVALDADLVLNGFEGGDDWKRRLRDLGIPVFSIYGATFDDALHDIRTVGTVTGASLAALTLTEGMASEAATIDQAVSQEGRASCFFEAYYPPLTTVGPNTFIFDILRRAGCDPVSAGAKGDYPQWSVDQLVKDSPDAYLAASESAASPAAVARRPGFSGISAVSAGKVFLIDSDLITRPGPRVVEALRVIAEDLHPGAFHA
jgi:iron complex transport system substrate-binding protein